MTPKRVFDYSTLSTSASAFSSQYVMPISRYIIVAVALYQTFGLVEDYSKAAGSTSIDTGRSCMF